MSDREDAILQGSDLVVDYMKQEFHLGIRYGYHDNPTVLLECSECEVSKLGLSMFTIKDDLESLEPYQPEKKE